MGTQQRWAESENLIPNPGPKTNAAFTLNGFDDQKRNLTCVKMDF